MNFSIAKHKAMLLERTDLNALCTLVISALVLTLQDLGHHCQQLKEGIGAAGAGSVKRPLSWVKEWVEEAVSNNNDVANNNPMN